MGSGQFEDQGWMKACYPRLIMYFPTEGEPENTDLLPQTTSSQCYTYVETAYGSPWYITIFFGGPGGNNC
jgi:neprosin-like protein